MYSLKLFLLFHVLITASSILWGKRNISGESSVKSKAPIEELNIGLTESFVPESYYINRAISSISLNSGSTEFTEYEEVHLPDTPIDSKNIGVSTLLIAQEELDKAFQLIAEEFLAEQKGKRSSDYITPKAEQLISLMVVNSIKGYMNQYKKSRE
jgi:hypothetical protein